MKALWARLRAWMQSGADPERPFGRSLGRESSVTLPCPICERDVHVRSHGYSGYRQGGPLWVYPGTRAMRLMCEEQHPDARAEHGRAGRRDRQV